AARGTVARRPPMGVACRRWGSGGRPGRRPARARSEPARPPSGRPGRWLCSPCHGAYRWSHRGWLLRRAVRVLPDNLGRVAVLFGTHTVYLEHDTGVGHPERPARLRAVARGIEQAGLADLLVPFSPRPATRA